MSQDCVFCKIVAGQIPSAKVLEDATKLAFLDINPVRPGHTLLIPRRHYARLTDMPASEAGELLSALPKLCAAVVKAAGADGFNIHQTNGPCAGQVVPHVHFHVIPRHDGDGYSFHWRSGKCSAADLEAWQRKIVEAMKGKA